MKYLKYNRKHKKNLQPKSFWHGPKLFFSVEISWFVFDDSMTKMKKIPAYYCLPLGWSVWKLNIDQMPWCLYTFKYFKIHWEYMTTQIWYWKYLLSNLKYNIIRCYNFTWEHWFHSSDLNSILDSLLFSENSCVHVLQWTIFAWIILFISVKKERVFRPKFSIELINILKRNCFFKINC